MKRILAVLCLAGVAGSSFAISGDDPTGHISVVETVTQFNSSLYDYTFTFKNTDALDAANNPGSIYEFGVYSLSDYHNLSQLSPTFGGTLGAFDGAASGNLSDAMYLTTDSVFGGLETSGDSGNIAANQSSSVSFRADTLDLGPTVFFAEVNGDSRNLEDIHDVSIFSYKGTVTPTGLTPEPSLMAVIGLVGLGTAFARRARTSA